jgi:hypothetical protein
MEESMRRTPRDLADAREELFEIQQQFGRLQKRIDALAEEELIEKLAGPRWAANGKVGVSLGHFACLRRLSLGTTLSTFESLPFLLR